ncbi:SH3 domain-containing protein [Acetatifactor muris]|uniref:Gamma-D-glutamyl-L-lysine endopeptidase n=1 Tax=Acetatifactor muris TaxID=879566 RepID=A0A2K4ZC18_9FIRM|nr:SH3 domain-containing protein [Acetatifactor muris]MCR2046451.1 SH3 domain-containing protein [Acetatifactor muris]SOY27980.1 Gamma-D-glutamyl-L-lysine endopeptidase [Acetatifactor muris]
MRYSKNRKIAMASAGLMLCLALEPLTVSAEENVLQFAGVTTLLESSLTTEEYIEAAQQAQGAAWGYTNIGVANVESGNLNVRQEPSTDSKMVGKMPKNSVCEVLETVDGWAHITSGEVEGYVNLDYLLIGPDAKLKANELVHTVVVVNTDGLNVRDEANTESAVLTQVPQGEELEYIETLEGWIKVGIDDEEAYVAAEYVTVTEKLDTAITMTELLYGAGVSDVRVELVEYAKQFLGNRYVWGGTSLTKGADCSGFVLSVFKKFGVSLPHHSGSQANSGTKISAGDLQPGDLVFYGNSRGTINHVAIYIGGGQVIHASSVKTGIKISNYKYRTPVKYVRILQD